MDKRLANAPHRPYKTWNLANNVGNWLTGELLAWLLRHNQTENGNQIKRKKTAKELIPNAQKHTFYNPMCSVWNSAYEVFCKCSF